MVADRSNVKKLELQGFIMKNTEDEREEERKV